MNVEKNKLIITASIGACMEIFDFFLFIFLLPILIKNFFPTKSLWMGLSIISISYICRPIGGMVLGNIGDYIGRKKVFNLSIFIMAISTLCIALLPTYHQIGSLSIILLLFFRIIQSFSLGAELPAAITYLYEKIDLEKSFVPLVLLSVCANYTIAFMSKSINFITNHAHQEFMLHKGFRLMFLFGSLIAIVGFVVRKSLSESSVFIHIKNKDKYSILTILKYQRKNLLKGVSICMLVACLTSIFMTTIPSILVIKKIIMPRTFHMLSFYGPIILATSSLFVAYCAKKSYYKKIMLISLLITCLTMVLLLFYSFSFVGLLISFTLSGINGLFFYYIAYLFPARNRYSGIAMSFNLAYVSAGILPILASIFIK